MRNDRKEGAGQRGTEAGGWRDIGSRRRGRGVFPEPGGQSPRTRTLSFRAASPDCGGRVAGELAWLWEAAHRENVCFADVLFPLPAS